jgi:hypothetical protein
MDADMRFLAAPKADPTRPDMFMKELEEERLDLKKSRVQLLSESGKGRQLEASPYHADAVLVFTADKLSAVFL